MDILALYIDLVKLSQPQESIACDFNKNIGLLIRIGWYATQCTFVDLSIFLMWEGNEVILH